MSEDTMPNRNIDPLEARVVVFRQQPEAKGFAELRNELREAGRGELLAELCATWAQPERDLDPMNDRASDRLLEIVEPEDPAAAVEILEQELGELAKRDNAKRGSKSELTARRAHQHRRAAMLWND